MNVEPDRPRATVIEVAVARSDKDDLHGVARRKTNEDVMRMQCHTAVDVVSTYSLHAIHYCAMR